MLLYQLPARSSTLRVYVWRKLKTAGVAYWKDSVCLLPDEPAHRAVLSELVKEINEAGGQTTLTTIQLTEAAEQFSMIERFRTQADEEYQEFLGKCRDFHEELAEERAEKHFTFAELEENEAELNKLRGWIVKAKARDYFGGKLAAKAATALKACEKDLEKFADEVAKAEETALKIKDAPRTRKKKSSD